jgi:hypothetical protein
MKLFNLITRLAFGASMSFAAVVVFCAQLLDYFS